MSYFGRILPGCNFCDHGVRPLVMRRRMINNEVKEKRETFHRSLTRGFPERLLNNNNSIELYLHDYINTALQAWKA